MASLFQNNDDGANCQAQAVLAYIRYAQSGIEPSWNADAKDYDARPQVYRWHNCREQGYVICMRGKGRHGQINIAFFEHRNSDEICALEWGQVTTSGNPPTIDTADFGGKIYKDKYDVSHRVQVGKAMEMADWINERLVAFWLKSAEG